MALPELEFHKLLNVLARLCSFELDEWVIEQYDLALSPEGYHRVNDALKQIIQTRKTRDAFPAISEIKAVLNPEVDDHALAIATAEKIWKMISEWGKAGKAQAYERLGPLGARVADEADWLWLCEQNASSGSFIKAQLRDLAKSVLSRSRAGILDQPIGISGRASEANTRSLEALGVKIKTLNHEGEAS